MFCMDFFELTFVLKEGERKVLVESIACRYSSGKHNLLQVIYSQSLIIQSQEVRDTEADVYHLQICQTFIYFCATSCFSRVSINSFTKSEAFMN